MIGKCTSRNALIPMNQLRPVLQKEDVGGPEAEHDQGVPVETVANPAPARPRPIFPHRESVDIAEAAAIEVSRCCVMDGVSAAPQIMGRHGDDADGTADPIIGQAMPKKGAMAAIVLNHEQTHEKAGRRHHEEHREPIAKIERGPHQQPQQDERHHSDTDLDDAACVAGVAVTRENARPRARVQHRFGGARKIYVGFQSIGFLGRFADCLNRLPHGA
jgi:hypothetical protein